MALKIFVLIAIVAALATGVSHEQAPRVTGFFSNFAYHTGSGDVGGVEVFISYAMIQNGLKSQHYAYVQIAEGVPTAPQLVPATVEGNKVSFRLTGLFDNLRFSGAVVGDSLIGQFSNGVALRLPRSPSYWQ